MDKDEYYNRTPELREWANKYGDIYSNHILWSLGPPLLSVLAVILGIVLQFRPLSWASANLLLLVALSPAIITGQLALRMVDSMYSWSRSGIYDGPSFPQNLITAHHVITLTYLRCLPALALYVILVGRLLLKRPRKV